jgi:hypothetical protein
MPSLVTLRFVCPTTRGELEYQLEADAKTLVDRWPKTFRGRCPYCKSLHKFSFREGYVDGMISQFGQSAVSAKSYTQFVER